MSRREWKPRSRRGRLAWTAVALLAALTILALIGRWDAARRRQISPELRRAVAQAGDSILSVARVRAWLDSRPERLSQDELRRWLEGWVEDQILAQAAARLGLDTTASVREDLVRLRLRFLRGLLEEQSLAESLTVSKLELRTWAKANEDQLALPERHVQVTWLFGEDSLALARMIPHLARGRVREQDLEELELRRGQSGYLARPDFLPGHAEAVAALKMLEVTPVLPLPGGWVIYQLTGQRPVGWLPDPEQDEELIRRAMIQDLRWKRLQDRLETIRREAVWKVDLTPLLEVESGVPPSRR
ncbi:MAG: hypothetical protein Q8O14_09570 [bacterium]|jgi:hypothetical protein|nr:hypothetical protein [bacterium]